MDYFVAIFINKNAYILSSLRGLHFLIQAIRIMNLTCALLRGTKVTVLFKILYLLENTIFILSTEK